MSHLFSAKAQAEKVVLTFDFSSALPSGATITSVDSVQVELLNNSDGSPSPALFVVGNPVASTTLVQVTVAGGVDGCDYRVTCRVNTTTPELLALAGTQRVRSAT